MSVCSMVTLRIFRGLNSRRCQYIINNKKNEKKKKERNKKEKKKREKKARTIKITRVLIRMYIEKRSNFILFFCDNVLKNKLW